MEQLAAALGLPEIYSCVQDTVATGMEALLILIQIDGVFWFLCLEDQKVN